MIADVAVMATEQHLEVMTLIRGHDVQFAMLHADMNQIKADVSSIKAQIAASDFAAEQRHENLLDAIRSLHGVPRTQRAFLI